MRDTGPEDSVLLDLENPWPGLAAFTEDCHPFFHGREAETSELFRLVQREPLTVLFGQSGLGKTSMLQAGLFPRLRAADFLPIYVRLNHDGQGPAPARQVAEAVHQAIRNGYADGPLASDGESLWEYFHRVDADFWSRRNRLLTPVIVLDQFEEMFTLGRSTEERRSRSEAFIVEFAGLIENRPPAELTERFDRGEADPALYHFEGSPCRVVLSLREDFLADLRGLRKQLRPVTGPSELRLTRMNGTQALEAIVQTGGALVETEVARRIVHFVAGASAEGDAADDHALASLQVEPALLSVICRELNQKRLVRGEPRITADLLSGTRSEILADFYDHSLRGMPVSTSLFIENKLLTPSGFRDSVALENAIGSAAMSREDIDTLVNRRLLRLDDRMGVVRVELMHDVLTGVIRDRRDQRFTRRRQLLAAGAFLSLVLALSGIGWGWWRAASSNILLGESQLRQGERRSALQSFAKAWRFGIRREKLSILLEDAARAMVNPVAQLRGHRDWVSFATFVDSDHVVTASWDKTVRLWNWRNGTHSEIAAEEAKLSSANLSFLQGERPTAERLVTATWSEGTCQVWGMDGKSRCRFRHGTGRVNWAAFSPDGTRIVSAADEPTVRMWDAASGEELSTFPRAAAKSDAHTGFVKTAVFIADGAFLLTASFDKTIKVWDAVTGELKGTFPHPDVVMAAAYHPRAHVIASATGNGSVLLWPVAKDKPWQAEGNARVLRCHGDKRVNAVAFSADGSRLVTAGDDRTAKVWDPTSDSGEPLISFEGHSDIVVCAAFSSDGKFVVTASKDGTAMVFDAIPVIRSPEEIVARARDFLPNLGESGSPD